MHSSQPNLASVVTPGNYDGVHLGHRALLRAARALAEREALRVISLTFDPHPLHFVAPDRAPPLLTEFARRSELLRGAGADEVVVHPFDQAFAEQRPEDFVLNTLVGRLRARGVVVGADFRFGAQRAGDVELLRSLGQRHGLAVEIVEPVLLEGQIVSSSQVRAALARGEVGLAARLLTRVHDITRQVIEGDKRGRTIGFPTANLALGGVMPPADGVYAVVVRIMNERSDLPRGLLRGVANLGVRPTLAAGRSLEVHVLDFSGDLYGAELRVGFVERLRGEQKFAGLSELTQQIASDVERARAVLAAAPEEPFQWI